MFKKFVIAYDHNVDKKTISRVQNVLAANGVECETFEDDKKDNDYPLLALSAFEMFKKSGSDGMVLLCGTGIGMNIVANKFKGIRSVLANSEADAYFSRRHENANCIVFGVGYNDGKVEVKLCRRKMERMLNMFLVTGFEGDEAGGERHIRRISEIQKIEQGGKN